MTARVLASLTSNERLPLSEEALQTASTIGRLIAAGYSETEAAELLSIPPEQARLRMRRLRDEDTPGAPRPRARPLTLCRGCQRKKAVRDGLCRGCDNDSQGRGVVSLELIP